MFLLNCALFFKMFLLNFALLSILGVAKILFLVLVLVLWDLIKGSRLELRICPSQTSHSLSCVAHHLPLAIHHCCPMPAPGSSKKVFKLHEVHPSTSIPLNIFFKLYLWLVQTFSFEKFRWLSPGNPLNSKCNSNWIGFIYFWTYGVSLIGFKGSASFVQACFYYTIAGE